MIAISLEHFSAVDYIQELRQADFTERQAEAVVKIVERQAQVIQEQKNDIDKQKSQIDNLTSKDLVTKGDVRESELRLLREIEIVRKEIEVVRKEIEVVRHDTLKFVIWTGVGVILTLVGTLGGMIAHGFHWW